MERAALVERLLAERPYCEACQIFGWIDGKLVTRSNRSVDIHEIKSRGRGGSILDEENLLAVCRFPCHRRITDDSKEAEWCGLALPGWATPEMWAEAAQRRKLISDGSHKIDDPSWW